MSEKLLNNFGLRHISAHREGPARCMCLLALQSTAYGASGTIGLRAMSHAGAEAR